MINAFVQGSYVKLDGRKAGVQGESRSKTLRLTFSPEWKDLEKSIVWQDARGENVVRVVLVPTTTEINEYGGLRIDTKIPGEALAYAGECAFTVTGYDLEDNARTLSAETVMQVEENELAGKEAVNAQEPTPDAVEQLQTAVNNAIGAAAADKAAAEKAATDANAAKTDAETAKTGAEEAAENAGKHEAGAKDAAEKSESARKLAESYTNNPPVPGDNGNWMVWDGEKYVDSGKKAIGKDGKAGYTPVKGKDYFDGAPGYTPQKGVDYFDGAPGYTPVKGKDYFDGANGVSPTVEVTEAEGGHMVAITDANGTKSFEVLDGADGQVWLVDAKGTGVQGDICSYSRLHRYGSSTGATYDDVKLGDWVICEQDGAVVTVTDKFAAQAGLSLIQYFLDGYTGGSDGGGKDGVSPTVEITEIDGGHRVTITDAEGEKFFDVLNGEDGVSPTVGVSAIEGGFRVTITDASGKRYFDVMNGAPGYTPVKGKDYFDGANGVSPTVEITEIEGGHRITITDAEGEHTFDVMNGVDGTSGSGGSADGLAYRSFSAGTDMNTLKATTGNAVTAYRQSFELGNDAANINTPAGYESSDLRPTVLAMMGGFYNYTMQVFLCDKTAGGGLVAFMRSQTGGSAWSEWQQVYPTPDIHTEIKLQSPGGKVFKVTVDDSGALSAVEVTE